MAVPTARSGDDLEKARLTWHPVAGGRRGPVVFEDDASYDIGPGSDERFVEVCRRMMDGRYYPPDAVVFEGDFKQRVRYKVGDRIRQWAPLFGRLGGPRVSGVVEIFVCDHDGEICHVGYVTTALHHARGIWQARLVRRDGRLILRVWSTAVPRSLLYWLGLPIGRYLQLRARRRSIEEFRRL